jgi:hypothetical protein
MSSSGLPSPFRSSSEATPGAGALAAEQAPQQAAEPFEARGL